MFLTPAAWKTPHSPIFNSEWKDKCWNIRGAVLFALGSVMLLLNRRYQTKLQATLGLLSRQHVWGGIGLRRAVETRVWWEKKGGLWSYNAYFSIQTTEQRHGPIRISPKQCSLLIYSVRSGCFYRWRLAIPVYHIATWKKLAPSTEQQTWSNMRTNGVL